MATERAPTLTVYSRTGCHLCDEMIADLRGMQASHRFELEIIDIDGVPGLEERYGERVPLLACRGRELCQYVLDRAAVTALLAEFR